MVSIINAIYYLFMVAIFARVILSFIVPMMEGRPHPALVQVITFVNQITEPILGPLRRVLPSFGALDLSPMAAILILTGIRIVLFKALF